MELWKIHKFCETASLSELRERRKQLKVLIDRKRAIKADAQKALEIVDEHIELKCLFED